MDYDKNVYCRLCAKKKSDTKLIDLQTDKDKHVKIIAKLNRINAGNFDFHCDDQFPKTVCYVCLNSLDTAFDFVVSIEQAQCLLTDLITSNIKQEAALADRNTDSENDVNDLQYEDVDHNVVVKLELGNQIADKVYSKKRKKRINKHQKVNKNREIHTAHLDAIPLSQLRQLSWKDYNWICSYCDTQFSNVLELRNHSMQYHNACNAYRCMDCNVRKLKLDSFMIHVKRYRQYLKWSCYICFEKFSNNRELKLHMYTHFNSSHLCPGCNTAFSTEEDLLIHKEIFYKGKKTRLVPDLALTLDLTCVLCKKDFKTKTSLTTHLLTHTDRKRNHTCDKCGKGFYSKPALDSHMILHNDTRPFQCVICKFSFKTKVQLRSHVGIHGGEKPFSCDQCGRCFRLQKQLTSHSIIHTDSLPYVCTYCNKSFRFKTILNQHIRQHTGVKPYSCTICQREFTNWPNYNKHMKRLHGMDMAKKKHTPDGVFPINPSTGELVVYSETNNSQEWKKELLLRKKPGRPKLTITHTDISYKPENLENNNVESECQVVESHC